MLIPHGALILVVDGKHMRLWRNHGSEAAPALSLVEEQDQKNPPSRAMATEGPGRSFESATPGSSTYPAADYHQRREDAFGAESLDRLEAVLGSDGSAILVAPPHMLGVLRGRVDKHLRPQIIAEIAADMTKASAPELLRLLSHHRD